MFEKILIANRGEIACRIMRTARRLGIRTVAVYSDVDTEALHVHMADEAYPVGPAPARDSYLRGDVILEVARQAGAQAVHPGYGFLSENAIFADACAAADLVFIGPPASAIRLMGIKSEAKDRMQAVGVPVIPGFHADTQDLKVISTEARKLGYPVLIKASAGGGGRGMRVVQRELDLVESVKSARNEARAAFGDDRILLERFVPHPRHIEVQIFADTQGNVVHLFERDCSIQRRHQKVIEEAPGAGVTEDLRAALTESAVTAVREVGYVGAGTIEFIVDRSGKHYFMEMNTRLQVEHAVTEMITGQDLVEWQLRVAAGQPLPLTQEEISMQGHAIEARVYAEDPRRGFLPQTGQIGRLRLPPDDERTRVDSGVVEGDSVSAHYDPMIAKVIAAGVDRKSAIQSLRRALEACQVVGVTTNLEFLLAVTRHPAYMANEIDTGFIASHGADLMPAPRPPSTEVCAIAVLHLLLDRRRCAEAAARASGDPTSPWALADGWRMNAAPAEIVTLVHADQPIEIAVTREGEAFVMGFAEGDLVVSGKISESGEISANLGGLRVSAAVSESKTGFTILLHGEAHAFLRYDPLAVDQLDETEGGRLTAPMPGRVSRVLVEDGADVSRGAALMVLEAMKMEHTITAPAGGRVEKIRFAQGDWVEEGATLLDLAVAE